MQIVDNGGGCCEVKYGGVIPHCGGGIPHCDGYRQQVVQLYYHCGIEGKT